MDRRKEVTDNFQNRLRDGIVLLDGAMGTELLRRGVPTKLPLWSAAALLEAPEVVQSIHADYIAAGADVITTNTFRTNVRVVEYPGSQHSARELTLRAAELALTAREESGVPGVLVAGGLAPVEDCYEPMRVPPTEALLAEHLVVAKTLQESGVDFIFSETMNSISEAVATAEVSNSVGLPLAMSLVCDQEGNLLSGESLTELVSSIAKYSPLFLAVNCRAPEVIDVALAKLSASAGDIPVGVYANGIGKPDDEDGWKFPEGLDFAAQQYLEHAKKWHSAGAKVIGGCCGTTPEYIAALRDEFIAR